MKSVYKGEHLKAYVYELHRDKIESEEDGLTLINSVEKLLFIDRKIR